MKKLDFGLIITVLLSLLLIEPLWQAGLPAGADIPIHLYRTAEFWRAWDEFSLPQWSPNLAFGYGYPLFIFAPPLPYLIGVALHALGLPFEQALKGLIIVTILLYATGAYLLGRTVWHSQASGLVCALAYAGAPFALREAILYGGNVPQLLAIGLFPWLLWATLQSVGTHDMRPSVEFADHDRYGLRQAIGWAIIAGGIYSAIILSHLFHALIISPVLVGFIVWLTFPRLKAMIAPLIAVPTGLLLSAFFWLPAFFERYATRAQADIYRDKSPFYVRYPDWTELLTWIEPLDGRAANPHVPLTLNLLTVGLAIAGLMVAFRPHRSSHARGWERGSVAQPPRIALFFTLLTLAAIYLILPISRPVWEIVTILQVAEFPWRLLGLANLGLAVLAGGAYGLPRPDRFWKPVRSALTLCLAAQFFSIAPLLYPVTDFAQYGQASLADLVNYERRSQSIGTTTLGEYLPHNVTIVPTGSPLVPELQANRSPDRLDRMTVPDSAEMRLIAQTATQHSYQITTSEPFTARLLHYNYLGWQATRNGQVIPLRSEADTGLMLIDLPAGSYTLEITFGSTPLRTAGWLISLIGGIGVILLGGWAGFKHGTDRPGRFEATLSPKFAGIVIGLILLAVLAKPLGRPLFTIDSPRSTVTQAEHTADVRFAHGIRLLGYDLSRDVVGTGERVQVVLYWQADEAPLPFNLQPFVHLDRFGDWVTVAENTNYTPGDTTTETVLPTFHWETDRYVRDEHPLTIPPDTPAQAYALRVGLIDPDQDGRLLPLADSAGDTATIGWLNVHPTQTPDPLATPVGATFGEAIELSSFALTDVTDEVIRFEVMWRTTGKFDQDYTIFSQIFTVEGQFVTGFDSPPLAGQYPTQTWLSHQSIRETRHIPLAEPLPAGDYQLIIGLYDPQTGQRLPVDGGGDFVVLGRFGSESKLDPSVGSR